MSLSNITLKNGGMIYFGNKKMIHVLDNIKYKYTLIQNILECVYRLYSFKKVRPG